MSRKNVPAAEVRNWFSSLSKKEQKGIPTPGSRGRLHPDTIAAFNKANRGKVYVTASAAEQRHVTVPVVTLTSTGRRTTRQVTIPTAEARSLLGHEEGRRGRFDMDLLSLAMSSVAANKVAGGFPKARARRKAKA